MNEPTKWYRGRNLFSTIEWVTSYILLFTIMFMVFAGYTDYIWVFGLITFIYLLSFLATQQYFMRIHSEEYAGVPVLDSWTDLDFDLGEEFMYPIAKIDNFPDISASARGAVDNFIDEMEHYFDKIQQGSMREQIEVLDSAITESETKLIENKGKKGVKKNGIKQTKKKK